MTLCHESFREDFNEITLAKNVFWVVKNKTVSLYIYLYIYLSFLLTLLIMITDVQTKHDDLRCASLWHEGMPGRWMVMRIAMKLEMGE